MRKWFMTGAVCLAAVLLGFTAECRAETMEQHTVLEGVESGAGVPEEIQVDAEDAKEYVPITSARVLREYWTKDFEFPVLFYVYDADYYEMGEYRIPRQEDAPGLAGYEDGLLETMGLDREDYVIETITWDGESYENEEGILCRDAVARGRKRMRDYEVAYAVEMEPEEEGSGRDQEETKVMADAPGQVRRVTDADVAGSGRKPDYWTFFKKVTIVTVAVWALLLMLIGLILLCTRLVKRLWGKRREERKQSAKDIFDY